MPKSAHYLFVALFLLIGGLWVTTLSRPVATFAAPAEKEKVVWDYNSVTVEANSLQAKLGELANDDWEVISIQIAESVLNTDNNPPRIQIDKYQVTGRRPRP